MAHVAKRRKWTLLSIIAVILGFWVWWPLGLAIIAYVIWGDGVDEVIWGQADKFRTVRSGNAAFDEYKEATLKRLEEEQRAFAEFVERLRHARDKNEFEKFMAERGQA